jgi:hypothetical protein
MVQVGGLDAGGDERAEQRLERRLAVVHAREQHALRQDRHASAADGGDRRESRCVQLAGMVGVQDQPERLVGFQRRGQRGGDEAGVCHRHAGVDAHSLDMRDGAEGGEDRAEPAGGEHQRVAAREDHLADRGPGADVGVGRLELSLPQHPAIGADALAAEAEPAIDGAGEQGLEKCAVGVAVDDALHGALRVIADRVGVLVIPHPRLVRVGDVLRGDGVGRVRSVDQPRDMRGDGDGVACRDRGEGFGLLGAHQPGGGESGHAAMRLCGRGAVRHGRGV